MLGSIERVRMERSCVNSFLVDAEGILPDSIAADNAVRRHNMQSSENVDTISSVRMFLLADKRKIRTI